MSKDDRCIDSDSNAGRFRPVALGLVVSLIRRKAELNRGAEKTRNLRQPYTPYEQLSGENTATLYP
jgi:hypothetical protein